jgi:threonine/homoserine/homoserine lactone efflux protein
MRTALAAALGLGVLVAAQVGPIWLLCARTALRGHLGAALGIGAGAAAVDLLYACLGVAGAAQLLRVTGLRVLLGVLGASVLVVLGARTLGSAFRIRLGAEHDADLRTPLAALRTGLVATASNPSTIVSWAGIFAAASTAQVATSVPATLVMLGGIGAGSLAWFTLLAFGMNRIGRRLGERSLRVADGLAGAGMVGFGGMLAFRTLRS